MSKDKEIKISKTKQHEYLKPKAVTQAEYLAKKKTSSDIIKKLKKMVNDYPDQPPYLDDSWSKTK